MIQPADNPASCWHRAGWVIQDPDTIFRNAAVHVHDGRISAVSTGRITGPEPVVDHGPGVILPALINAHTHLELGALKGRLPVDQGFAAWVRHLIDARKKLSRTALKSGISDGIRELLDTGCGTAGEISTLGLSRQPFLQSLLHGVWFREYIGNGKEKEIRPDITTSRESLAGHAPHTTAPDLLAMLAKQTERLGRPFSIHLAESTDEDDFIRTGKGPWADLLKSRGIDFSTWPLPAPGPVRYLDRLGALRKNTLAVHLLLADGDDFRILACRGASVAVCPRSNSRLHRRLPDLDRMGAAGLNICLGTDSLASCDSLSMFDEMAFAARHFPELSPRAIFAMVTVNAARALGLKNDCGRIGPTCRADCLYLPVSAASPQALMEQMINTPIHSPIERIDCHAA